MNDTAALQCVLDHLARLALDARENGDDGAADAYWIAFDLVQSLLDAPDGEK